jgi:predicted metalloenzyme YecM
MAQLDSYYQQLAPQLGMFDAQADLHSYYFPIQDAHQAFRVSTRRHVDYWQQLFKRCGRKVGR